jgi:hypothetical protein
MHFGGNTDPQLSILHLQLGNQLFEKYAVTEVGQEIPHFYGIQWFITVFKIDRC